MSLDSETIKTILLVINMLGELAIGVWLYLEKRNDKTNERVDAVAKSLKSLEKDVDARLDDMSPRLKAVETQLENMPTHDDLGELHEKINGVARELSDLNGNVSGMKHLLHSIDDYLRNNK